MDDFLKRLKQESRVSEEALSAIKLWLVDSRFESFKSAIKELVDRQLWEELDDSFYTHLKIGTGGIRGVIGVGPNRINSRTISEAAQGLCNFIVDTKGADGNSDCVVVGYEARRSSKQFAILSCRILAANGVRSQLFDGPRSTPELSFAVRHLGATAGVQITASHNPRTDNGFKFYWSDGAQIVPPDDIRFMELVSAVNEISLVSMDDAVRDGFVSYVGDEIDKQYVTAICGLSTYGNRSSTVVFSPMHGVGATNVLPVLKETGFHVTSVQDQLDPDEDFPTAVDDLINPEFLEVMDRSIDLATQLNTDLAICSDPDADRIGVAAKSVLQSPDMTFLTGNQVGAALTHYLLSHRHDNGILSHQDVVLTTLVTTTLVSDIVVSFGLLPRANLPVGFKFIAQAIGQIEEDQSFVFAAEESLGYLAGYFVRDKDAAIASLLVCEMVSWLKDKGQTLPMYLDTLYEKYGYYKNILLLLELPGRSGSDLIDVLMGRLHVDPPREIGGFSVRTNVDYLGYDAEYGDDYAVDQSTNEEVSLFLSNDKRTRVIIRPSGTEPKLKIYIQHFGMVMNTLEESKLAVDGTAMDIGENVKDYCRSILPPDRLGFWDHADIRVV